MSRRRADMHGKAAASYYDPLPLPASCPLFPRKHQVFFLPDGIHASLTGPLPRAWAVSLPIIDLLKGLRFGLRPGSQTHMA